MSANVIDDITTRTANGSALTTAQMDSNLTELARAASTSQNGNVQLNDTTSSNSTTQAATANAVRAVQAALDIEEAKGLSYTSLGTGRTGVGTFAITDYSNYDIIEGEGLSSNGAYSTTTIMVGAIVTSRDYTIPEIQISSGGGDALRFQFNSTTQMQIMVVGNFITRITRVSGIRYA